MQNAEQNTYVVLRDVSSLRTLTRNRRWQDVNSGQIGVGASTNVKALRQFFCGYRFRCEPRTLDWVYSAPVQRVLSEWPTLSNAQFEGWAFFLSQSG
jgi:hypothetical protein